MTTATKQTLKGFIASNFVALAIIGITKYTYSKNGDNTFIFSEFVVIPMLMGIISAWIWRDLRLHGGKLLLYSCYNGLLAILLSFIFLGEGVICLLIVSPLILSFIIAGAFIGRYMSKKSNSRLNTSILLLLGFIYIGDTLTDHKYENVVSDSVTVNAPPARVWKNVVAFKKINQPASFWLFRLGLPRPVETTVSGYYKGADRKCIFSNGYVFDEKIAAYEINKDLVFDIVYQPRDPEIMNHIDIVRGQFLLQDNGNGTTTLTGNSWYKLYVFPSWYYDLWSASIVRNVHTRVMDHIKQLSENQ